jgi:periplasmic protein TonB
MMIALLSLLLTFSGGLQRSVNDGKLYGRASDEKGDPVGSAMIFLSGTTYNRAALTNAQGYYVFLEVPTGTYSLKATKYGFAKLTRNSVTVAPQSSQRQDFQFSNESMPVLAENKPSRKTEVAKAPSRTEATKNESLKPVKSEPIAVAQKTVVAAPPERVKQDSLEVARAVAEAEAQEAALNAVPDAEPEIVGGIASILRHISYPRIAQQFKLEGKTVVRVAVSKDGKAKRMDILNSAGEVLDEEAVRVITDTDFKPAQFNGKAVDATIIIPVTFKLK